MEIKRIDRLNAAAKYYGIENKIAAITDSLSDIDDINALEIDVDNYGDTKQICVLPCWNERKYLRDNNYFPIKRKFIHAVIDTMAKHNFTRTIDSIEDYGGGWLYIVFQEA